MKYYKPLGFLASIVLVISCFLPWAYYPDLQKSFTGFFTEQNMYGKPGIVFVFFAVASVILIFINKIWAKRTLIFFAALNVGYLLKTYVIFTSCYRGYCPEKQYGIYLLTISCVTLLVVSFFPDLKVNDNKIDADLPPSVANNE
ncbi:MAG TPA: hypothetical protein VFT78_01950 [Hanamia sp.]|jgi:hypothetical protein|nr:hypothetical protein [Hanamia sp.]